MNKRFLTLLLALVAIVTGSKAQTDSETPLTLEALETTIVTISTPREITTFYYQRNDKANVTVNYTALKGSNVTSIRLSKGDKLKLWGNCTQYGSSDQEGSTRIDCDGDCYIYGNVMSMYNMDAFASEKVIVSPYTFAYLFRSNTHIKNHSTKALVLPATMLTTGCYRYMFLYCTGLTVAPTLPATTLANGCYLGMFCHCESLTAAPALPATTLAARCYLDMFNGCTRLETAPDLPATTLKDYCYQEMFRGCESLNKAPTILPATEMAIYCYAEMFYGCTSLKTAPQLPATTLADGCYSEMFYQCTGLTTAPNLPATTLTKSCYFAMFSGCTNLTTAPYLSATNLANKSYQDMFHNCSKLNELHCMALQFNSDVSANFLLSVASNGTFYKNPNANDSNLKGGYIGVPTGWSIINDPNASESIRYDLDGNGKVDAADITKLVDYIMSH